MSKQYNVSGVIFTLSTPSESLFEVRWAERVKIKNKDDVELNILALNDKFSYKIKNLRAKAYRILNEFSVKVGNTYIVPKSKLPFLMGRLEELREEYRQFDETVEEWVRGEGKERIASLEEYIRSKTGSENVSINVKSTAERLSYSFVDFRLDDDFVNEFMAEVVSEAEEYARQVRESAHKESARVREKIAEEYARGMEVLRQEIEAIREKKVKEIEASIVARVREVLGEVAGKGGVVQVRLARLKENVEALGLKYRVLDDAVAAVNGDLDASKRLAEYFGLTPLEDCKANIALVASAEKEKHVLLSVNR
ncbi:MAG: hypothetical protein QXJ62_03875 [Nitrososphaeria archaeon]